MSARNVLQTTIDDFAQAAGFRKQSGTWCRRQQEAIVLIELQKSQYGAKYFVNVALWLLELGDVRRCPKEQQCHVRSRLTRVLPNHQERLSALLDLEDTSIEEDHRRVELLEILDKHLLPLLDSYSTLDQLRSLQARGLLSSALITGPAQQILSEPAP